MGVHLDPGVAVRPALAKRHEQAGPQTLQQDGEGGEAGEDAEERGARAGGGGCVVGAVGRRWPRAAPSMSVSPAFDHGSVDGCNGGGSGRGEPIASTLGSIVGSSLTTRDECGPERLRPARSGEVALDRRARPRSRARRSAAVRPVAPRARTGRGRDRSGAPSRGHPSSGRSGRTSATATKRRALIDSRRIRAASSWTTAERIAVSIARPGLGRLVERRGRSGRGASPACSGSCRISCGDLGHHGLRHRQDRRGTGRPCCRRSDARARDRRPAPVAIPRIVVPWSPPGFRRARGPSRGSRRASRRPPGRRPPPARCRHSRPE